MSSSQRITDSDLEQMIGRAAALPDAPDGWISHAVGLFEARTRRDVVGPLQALLNRVVAVLQFDSWAAGPMPAGVRSLPSETRHLLFSMQGRDIDLRITPAADAYAVAGQILGPDDTGVVELSRDTDEPALGIGVRSTPLDELGEFRLEGVHRGTYRVTLRVGHDEIALPPIAVGDRPS